MANRTPEQLQVAIDVIRNETVAGANTKARVADVLQDIADSPKIDAIPAVFTKAHGSMAVDLVLSADPSTATLAVVLTGLAPSSTYHAVVGASQCVGLTATPETGGFIDIIAELSIVTDASSVATCTIASANVIVDITKLEAGVSTMTGNIAASAGGFTIYATRVVATSCTVFEVEYWASRLVKVA